jgi:hypothetical protein
VSHFNNVTQRAAVELFRQQFEKASEIGRIELFSRRELPEQWTEVITELRHA